MPFKKITDKLEKYKKENAFIFIPSPVLSEKESFYMPVIDVVYLTKDDVYKSSGVQGAHRIKFTGLSKFALSANIEWSLDGTGRTDNRTDKLYCSYEATGGVRNADGSVSFYKAEKDLDLEVSEMEFTDLYNSKSKDQNYINKCIRRDMIQKRKNKLMLVESGAKSRVIRFLLGLPGQVKDINKLINRPFVIVSYVINYSRPDVKGVILGNLANDMSKIYGSRQHPERIDYSSGDAIDINPEESEPEEEQQDKELIDFQNSSIEIQTQTLLDICDEKKLDFSLESRNAKPEDHDQTWRDGFFKHLRDK